MSGKYGKIFSKNMENMENMKNMEKHSAVHMSRGP